MYVHMYKWSQSIVDLGFMILNLGVVLLEMLE